MLELVGQIDGLERNRELGLLGICDQRLVMRDQGFE